MNTTPPLVVAILTLLVVSPLPAEDSKSPVSQNSPAASGEELLAQRKAAIAAAKEAARQAHGAAAAARQKHNIIDPDPDGTGVTLSPKDDLNVIEYLRLKEAYFKAKAEIATAEEASYAALPIEHLQAEVNAAEKEMTEAFAKVAEFLQSGKVTDPNPDDSKSGVSLDRNDKEAAASYLNRKAIYLALKGRATKAQKALAAAKARKTPAADVTK